MKYFCLTFQNRWNSWKRILWRQFIWSMNLWMHSYRISWASTISSLKGLREEVITRNERKRDSLGGVVVFNQGLQLAWINSFSFLILPAGLLFGWSPTRRQISWEPYWYSLEAVTRVERVMREISGEKINAI